MLGTIYKITNHVNGKCYIGQTSKVVSSRWKEHLYDSRKKDSQAIHRAMRKYGLETFSIETIAKVPTEFLDALESFFIIACNSHITQNGYNMTFGGSALGSGEKHPCFGKKLSPEHKVKIGNAHRGMKRSVETRMKQRAAAIGRKHSEETKAKMRGKKLSEFTKAKQVATRLGRIPWNKGVKKCKNSL